MFVVRCGRGGSCGDGRGGGRGGIEEPHGGEEVFGRDPIAVVEAEVDDMGEFVFYVSGDILGADEAECAVGVAEKVEDGVRESGPFEGIVFWTATDDETIEFSGAEELIEAVGFEVGVDGGSD